MVKSRYIGDGHPTFNRNPYNWYVKPYYWVDDHSLLYGNNGSLDPSTYAFCFCHKWELQVKLRGTWQDRCADQMPAHIWSQRIMPIYCLIKHKSTRHYSTIYSGTGIRIVLYHLHWSIAIDAIPTNPHLLEELSQWAISWPIHSLRCAWIHLDQKATSLHTTSDRLRLEM